MFGAWKRLEPPVRARPISIVVLIFSFADDQDFLEMLGASCSALLVYHLMLPAQVCNLLWTDITLGIVDAMPTVSIAIENSKTPRKFSTEFCHRYGFGCFPVVVAFTTAFRL